MKTFTPETCHENLLQATPRQLAFDPQKNFQSHLLIPQQRSAPFPAVICLQGHTTGMHISLGRPKYEGDEELIAGGDRDFAIQAVREGYAALVLEQRCFGERKDQRPPELAVFGHIGKTEWRLEIGD